MDDKDALDRLVQIITSRFPELSGGRFSLITMGYDSLAVDVDDRWIFKFPKEQYAEEALQREAVVLKVIRNAVTLRVPQLELFGEPTIFSRHAKIPGNYLTAADYSTLADEQRQGLARDLSLFYAQLHGIPLVQIEPTGIGAIHPWFAPDRIEGLAIPQLPPEDRLWALNTLRQYQALPPDPYGDTYGFFDGHGWNMAYDYTAGKLNGIYDFADSGIGPLQQDFIYSHFIDRDLTVRIIGEYESVTGRHIDIARVDLLFSVLLLHELAEAIEESGDCRMPLAMLAQRRTIQGANGGRSV